jgi:hypothetical protein
VRSGTGSTAVYDPLIGARSLSCRVCLVATLPTGRESPISSPPGFRAGLCSIRFQLMSQATGWWLWLQPAAYSAGVR